MNTWTCFDFWRGTRELALSRTLIFSKKSDPERISIYWLVSRATKSASNRTLSDEKR
jgi:hypothetical protein